MSLARFKKAQDSRLNGFATALDELQQGAKRSHWIWYVFPQLAGLGHSSTAEFYGLQDVEEARAYLADDELYTRLRAVTDAARQHITAGTNLVDLMGGTTDALKLVSSLTLFERVALEDGHAGFARHCADILAAAESQGFPRCTFTHAALEDAQFRR